MSEVDRPNFGTLPDFGNFTSDVDRYDAVERVLHIAPNVEGDFRSFLCTATGFGTVGVRDGKPFVEIRSGEIPYAQIRYSPRVGS